MFKIEEEFQENIANEARYIWYLHCSCSSVNYKSLTTVEESSKPYANVLLWQFHVCGSSVSDDWPLVKSFNIYGVLTILIQILIHTCRRLNTVNDGITKYLKGNAKDFIQWPCSVIVKQTAVTVHLLTDLWEQSKYAFSVPCSLVAYTLWKLHKKAVYYTVKSPL